MSAYTDADRLRELAAIRSIWVEMRVDRFIDQRDGDVSVAQVAAKEDESYAKWREFYPALSELFPSHLAEGVSA